METQTIAIIVDGASSGNGGSCGVGVVVKDADTKEILMQLSEPVGKGTNNFAEFKALSMGLDAIEAFYQGGVRKYILLSDSELIVSCVLGRFKVRNENIKVHNDECRAKLATLRELPDIDITIDQIPREYTGEADKLAKEASQRGKVEQVVSDYPFLV